jgi:hypothetical protein
LDFRRYPVLAVISNCYSEPRGRFPRVTHPCATKAEAFVRLACVRHAASVRSEPGSNSQVCVTCLAARAETRHPQGMSFKEPIPALSNVMDTKDMQDNGLILTGCRGLEFLGPGAVAHMSLHLNQQCQRTTDRIRRTTIPPRFYGPGDWCPSLLATNRFAAN